MSQILCPYCFTTHTIVSNTTKGRECPHVKFQNIETKNEDPNKQEEIPLFFVKEYQKARPIWLTTVGFSKHGKTCYVAALASTLEALNRVWPDSSYRVLDQRTLAMLENARIQEFRGDIPHTTGLEIPRPIFISTYDIPTFGSNCLVLYDTPGELYQKFQGQEDTKSLQPLKASKNIWFLVSLRDLKGSETKVEKKISDLLTVYLDGMEKLGCSLSNRNLIVVYTQADAIIGDMNYGFPESIKRYYHSDPFQNLANFEQEIPNVKSFAKSDFITQYIDKMKKISDELQKFTRRLPGGNAFIHQARMHGMGLYFSITSALGAEPDIKHRKVLVETVTRPHRVLDPYLWALYLNEEVEQSNCYLILDGSKNSDSLYQYNLQSLTENLQEKVDIITYIMGQNEIVSVVGQAPPKIKPRVAKLRLIGPLLEKAPKDTKFIVLTTGKIHDLEDFSIPEWHGRILRISIGEENFQPWPKSLIIRPNDEISVLYDEVSRFLDEK